MTSSIQFHSTEDLMAMSSVGAAAESMFMIMLDRCSKKEEEFQKQAAELEQLAKRVDQIGTASKSKEDEPDAQLSPFAEGIERMNQFSSSIVTMCESFKMMHLFCDEDERTKQQFNHVDNLSSLQESHRRIDALINKMKKDLRICGGDSELDEWESVNMENSSSSSSSSLSFSHSSLPSSSSSSLTSFSASSTPLSEDDQGMKKLEGRVSIPSPAPKEKNITVLNPSNEDESSFSQSATTTTSSTTRIVQAPPTSPPTDTPLITRGSESSPEQQWHKPLVQLAKQVQHAAAPLNEQQTQQTSRMCGLNCASFSILFCSRVRG